MDTKKVTVLPDGPVTRGRARGIPRLGPDDGIIDFDRQRASIIRRDQFGGKLIDVVDPVTGYCVDVRSNGYSLPNNNLTVRPGVSGGHNSTTRQSCVDKVANGIYLGADGRVVRTTSMGEGPIPSAPKSNPAGSTKPLKKRRTVNPSGAVGGSDRTATPNDYVLPDGTVILVPGGQTGRYKQADIESAIRVSMAARGRTLPDSWTPNREALRAGRAILKRARADILAKHGITEA